MATTQPIDSTMSIQELVKLLGSEDQKTEHGAYQALLEKILPTTSDRQKRKKANVPMAAALAHELNAQTPPTKDKRGREIPPKHIHSAKVRNKILRLMSFVAEANDVSQLGNAIRVIETREMTLYLLDRNESADATGALIDALNQVGPEFRVGVVNCLAKREGANVLATLQKTASNDSEREVRLAAIEALAKFSEPAHDAIIAKAAGEKCPCIKRRAHKARVRLAETLAQADKPVAAKKVCQAILDSDAGEPQKKAAQIILDNMVN